MGIFRFILPYKSYLIGGLILLIFTTMSTMLFVFLAGKIVDVAQGNSWLSFESVGEIALAMVVLLVVTGVISFFRTTLVAKVSEYAIVDIRVSLYNKLITLPMFFFEQRRVGELTSRITTDVEQLKEMLAWVLVELLRQVGILIVGIGFILFITPILSLIMIATFPVAIIMAVVMGKMVKKLSRKTQDEIAAATTIVEETFQAIQTVKAYTNEFFESKRYVQSMERSRDLAMKAAYYRAGVVSFIIVGIFGGIVLVLWQGGLMIADGRMSSGDLLTFVLFTAFIGGAVGTLGDLYARLQKTVGASERILQILEEHPETDFREIRSKAMVNAGIRFEDVEFSYPSRDDVGVLRKISLDIKEGQKVAIVGASGSGKSTIVKLLLRFYSLSKGRIEIGGKPHVDYNISELRSNMGIVPQDVILFGTSIRENIAYGKLGASDQEIEAAAKKANAWEFISAFPQEMNTLVGERGLQLSGGQKQRIAIARAILKDPKILLLDEATSSLDSESEKVVQEALDELMIGRTTIIIAHRLSTIRNVDRIYVLDKGQIVESGSHEELMIIEKGIYRHLTQLQLDTGVVTI